MGQQSGGFQHMATSRNAIMAYRLSMSDILHIPQLDLTITLSISNTCCNQWDVAPVNCLSSSCPQLVSWSLQSIVFWIVMLQPKLSHTPNASIVICTPRIQTGKATVTYDLASSAIANLSLKEGEQADLQLLGSLVDSVTTSHIVEFHGYPYNGYFLKDLWQGVDSYKDKLAMLSLDRSIHTIIMSSWSYGCCSRSHQVNHLQPRP